jgi:hypothetical protein
VCGRKARIAEQKQIAHQFLEHHRLAGIQAIDVQITLILQFVKAFLQAPHRLRRFPDAGCAGKGVRSSQASIK